MYTIRIFAASLLMASGPALAGYESNSHYHDYSYGYTYASGSLQAAHDSYNSNDSIGCTTTGSPGSRFVVCTSFKGNTVASCYSTDPYVIDAASRISAASIVSFGYPTGGTVCDYVSVRSSSEALSVPREIEEPLYEARDAIYSETEWLAALISYYAGW